MVFFGEIYVFLQLSTISLFVANWANPSLETPKFQEVLISKTNSIVTGKQDVMLLLLTQMVFFGEIHVFCPLN
jgi:hypothetical protein